jgi:hypothetical protein
VNRFKNKETTELRETLCVSGALWFNQPLAPLPRGDVSQFRPLRSSEGFGITDTVRGNQLRTPGPKYFEPTGRRKQQTPR